MNRFLPLALLFVSLAASAQPSPPDTLATEHGWLKDLTFQLAGSQAGYSNWQEGGVDALAISGLSEGVFYRVDGKIRQAHEIRFGLGVLKQDTLGFRKSNDVARYGFGLQLDTGTHFSPSYEFGARSQFLEGFSYTPAPEAYPGLVRRLDGSVKVSDAFSPLVLSQSAGVVYDPGGGFTARTGLGLKETLVSIERLRPVYGNALDEPIRIQAGLDAELRLKRTIAKNVIFSSRLMAFQAFNQLTNTAPDLLFENRLTMKVNSLLNVTIDTAALFDRDISDDIQLRESVAVGVAFSLL